MKKLFINCAGGCTVIENTDMLSQLGEHVKSTCKNALKTLIVTDENVAKLYLDDVRFSLESAGFLCFTHVLKAGEQNKNLSAVEGIYECLMQENFKRTDCIISLGGGIVGDISGFACATYMRGMTFVQVPTTIISQTDSSVGGKDGVNFRGIKNLIGCFYQPKLVYIDTSVLQTLNKREYSAGMAEVIKYGCIYDRELFDMLLSDNISMQDIIMRCLSIKSTIVEHDEFDRGERRILNFGHTIGHAIEACTKGDVLHGEGVALGMIKMAELGEACGLTETGTCNSIKTLLNMHDLKTDIPHNYDYKKYLMLDKKGSGDKINIVLLSKIGSAFVKPFKLEELLKLIR